MGWAGKKEYLLIMAEVLECEGSVLFGFYVLLSRQAVPQLQLSACFYLLFTASVVIYLPICKLGNVYCYSQVLSKDEPAALQVYSRNNFSLREGECLK